MLGFPLVDRLGYHGFSFLLWLNNYTPIAQSLKRSFTFWPIKYNIPVSLQTIHYQVYHFIVKFESVGAKRYNLHQEIEYVSISIGYDLDW